MHVNGGVRFRNPRPFPGKSRGPGGTGAPSASAVQEEASRVSLMLSAYHWPLSFTVRRCVS